MNGGRDSYCILTVGDNYFIPAYHTLEIKTDVNCRLQPILPVIPESSIIVNYCVCAIEASQLIIIFLSLLPPLSENSDWVMGYLHEYGSLLLMLYGDDRGHVENVQIQCPPAWQSAVP